MPKKSSSFRGEYIKTMVQFSTAAFSFVAALAWNEAIKNFIGKFFSPGSGFKSSLIYAILVTTVAVLVTYYLGRLAQRVKEEEG